MAEDIRGYTSNQIIRKSTGSPAVLFVFPFVTESVSICNTGSTSIYYIFDNTATAGSTSGFIDAFDSRDFDFRVGSVSIMASGTGTLTPVVECIGAR